MFIDKKDAEELRSHARQAIAQLQNWMPDGFGMEEEIKEIKDDIARLQSSLGKLDKAIEKSPTK